VIHPPVDIRFFTPNVETPRADFYLAAGALTPYKRIDVILQAFKQIGKRLVIAGTGPEIHRLRGMADSGVEFLGWVSDSDLRGLYRRARGLVFAAREDFGITPVEAMACGCPVLAFAEGGALETVRNKISGLFFHKQTADAIARAVQRFESVPWSVEQVRSQIERFSRETFKKQFQQFVDEKLSDA